MLTAEKVKNYLKTIIEPFLPSDITTDFHSEFYYNPEAVANFTIKLLTGTIQSKITQNPIQLICEVDNNYYQDVIDALNELAITYNETITNLDNTSVRQFYSTPVVIGTFKNDGLEVKTTISIDINFLTFENLLDLKSLKINGEEITFLRTALTYSTNINSTGALNDNYPGVVRQLVYSCGNSFTFSVLLKNSKVLKGILMNQMIYCSNMNENFELDLLFNDNKIIIPCILTSASLSKEINGFPLLDISFMRGDF